MADEPGYEKLLLENILKTLTNLGDKVGLVDNRVTEVHTMMSDYVQLKKRVDVLEEIVATNKAYEDGRSHAKGESASKMIKRARTWEHLRQWVLFWTALVTLYLAYKTFIH